MSKSAFINPPGYYWPYWRYFKYCFPNGSTCTMLPSNHKTTSVEYSFNYVPRFIQKEPHFYFLKLIKTSISTSKDSINHFFLAKWEKDSTIFHFPPTVPPKSN